MRKEDASRFQKSYEVCVLNICIYMYIFMFRFHLSKLVFVVPPSLPSVLSSPPYSPSIFLSLSANGIGCPEGT